MKRRNLLKLMGIGAGAPLFYSAPCQGLAGVGMVDLYLDQVEGVIGQGPFSDTWDSLLAYSAPEWYKDAKFGIFIHWGVYSVPAAYSEWYPREMYNLANPLVWTHHRLKWGSQRKFGYKDFIPLFTAEEFDPQGWAELFRKAGARYVVPVAEHHDGFAMYDCSFSEWNAVKMGPRRDVIGELAEAVRGQDMYYGVSSHRAAHWWFMNGGRQFPSDVSDPLNQDFYGPAQPMSRPPDHAFMRDWLARSSELCDKYRPSVFWFDFGFNVPAFEPYRRKLAAYYYNRAAEWGEEVVINYKYDAFPDGAAVLDLERAGLNEIRPLVWQTDTSVSYLSWSHIENDLFKDPHRLISVLVDTVSKNGVLLLNVGPTARGVIPPEAAQRLLEIGEWLEVNGEAIYDSRPWKVFGEGPTRPARHLAFGLGELLTPKLTARDIRFTAKNDDIYAAVMDWPRDRRVKIRSLAEDSGRAAFKIDSVSLLGHDGPVEWTRGPDALEIRLPGQKPCDYAFVLKIEAGGRAGGGDSISIDRRPRGPAKGGLR